MLYKDFKGLSLSALGFGCMRFPVLEGDDARIDEERSFEMIDYAMEHGINYYDTAYGYHGGNSEAFIGRALKKYPRDSYFLASKFPGYDLSNMDKVEEIFRTQLERCQTDYFDFYLYHNVCELNIDAYLDPKYGIHKFLMRMKEEGRIRHLGFSTHGTIATMKRFLDAYGRDMEFCQIQLNFVDWEFQDAKSKVELLDSYGLPVWVMEPVRGGRIAKLLDEESERGINEISDGKGVPRAAFLFVKSIPEVGMVLSGMSNMDQLREHIATFSDDRRISREEFLRLTSIARELTSKGTVPCTACHYCVSHCPRELDIPELISLYNEFLVSGKGSFIAPMRVRQMPEEKRPSACIGCRSCEAVCPQQIKVSEVMSDFDSRLSEK